MGDGTQESKAEKDRREGNTCIALGAGVGALGAISAAITGALCPLCIFVAPGLVGVGAIKRWQGTKAQSEGSKTNEK